MNEIFLPIIGNIVYERDLPEYYGVITSVYDWGEVLCIKWLYDSEDDGRVSDDDAFPEYARENYYVFLDRKATPENWLIYKLKFLS